MPNIWYLCELVGLSFHLKAAVNFLGIFLSFITSKGVGIVMGHGLD
jgi:hypothetical protein